MAWSKKNAKVVFTLACHENEQGIKKENGQGLVVQILKFSYNSNDDNSCNSRIKIMCNSFLNGLSIVSMVASFFLP